METLEIHSKSFLIKWVNAPGNSTISWKVKPTKKSINFGLCRHIGEGFPPESSVVKKSEGTLEEKLVNSGLDKVLWHGRCEPGELLDGNYFVPDDAGGVYALVFDNMFSKNTAKTVLFSQQVEVMGFNFSLDGSVGSLSSVGGIGGGIGGGVGGGAGGGGGGGSGSGSSSVGGSISSGSSSRPILRSASVSGSSRRLSIYANRTAAAAAAAAAAAGVASNVGGDGKLNSTIANSSTGAPPMPLEQLGGGCGTGNGASNGATTTTGGGNGMGINACVGIANNGSNDNLNSNGIQPPTQITSGTPTQNRSRSQTVGSIQTVTPTNETKSQHAAKPTFVSTDRYMSGVILKKRRKKLQGYGRRYFILDRKYGLLNYYLDQKSSLLRGSMPIRLCAITAIENTREIVIDSGMEIWSLKAQSSVDWKAWISELDVISRSDNFIGDREVGGSAGLPGIDATIGSATAIVTASSTATTTTTTTTTASDDIWNSLTKLIEKLETSNDLAQSIVNVPQLPIAISSSPSNNAASSTPPTLQRRPSFWKRKNSKAAVAAATTSETSTNSTASNSFEDLSNTLNSNPSSPDLQSSQFQTPTTDPRVKDLSNQLSSLVKEFQLMVAKHNAANIVTTSSTTTDGILSVYATPSRRSLDVSSIFSDDLFYDASENFGAGAGVHYIDYDDSDNNEIIFDSDGDGEIEGIHKERRSLIESVITEEKLDLYPLPLPLVKRRRDITESKTTPPSLIGVLRKNVGKDLSTVAMPVSTNEPLSILQKLSEIVEYSELLDKAAAAADENERSLLVATFAVSYMASQRSKERALRKPFNPLLGETFELVREDKGFRLIAEKVSHRPPIMAIQAESADWTLHYTARPHQKYWGKSIELTDNGPVRIRFHRTGDAYEYLQPSTFLRNIIAGTKYIEPVGSVSVESSNGGVALIEYKAGGMFSGSTEEVTIKAFNERGEAYSTVYEGKWSDSIYGPGKKIIWKVGNLVPKAQKKYGFTEWSASLNEITSIEEGKVSPTDSRLRPDQRLYEEGIIEKAEALKLELEERQRQRRKVMEEKEESWEPVFFNIPENGNSEPQFYTLKEGEENYWIRRREQNWAGTTKLW